MEKRYISSNGEQIRYFLKRANQKNIILKIKEGDIYVSAPELIPVWEIEKFIYKHISKIKSIKMMHELSSKHDFFSSNPWILIFDQKVMIKIFDENVHTKIDNETIIMKNYLDNIEQLKKIYAFLGKEYKNWFTYRTKFWGDKMGVTFKNLTVKVMKGKWGVCFPSESKIVLNTKLIHFKPEYIDYVIIHELSHLIYPNHSKDFWYNVAKFIPNYKEISKIINSAGV